MRRWIGAILLLAGLAYPFVVYFSLEHVRTVWLALPLAALWLLRAIWAPSLPGGKTLPIVTVIFCIAMAIADSSAMLRAYPVLINAMLFFIFTASLQRGPPIIERIARLAHPILPPSGVRYTRRVTQVWAFFFAVNGSVAAALALWGPWSWWTVYNGGLSYLAAGLLMAGEWLLRPTYAKEASS